MDADVLSACICVHLRFNVRRGDKAVRRCEFERELAGDSCMRAPLIIAILLMFPVIARANPVMIDGQSLIAFGIVAFWALVIESGIATLALVSAGVSPGPNPSPCAPA
jgi:hypothetical protein